MTSRMTWSRETWCGPDGEQLIVRRRGRRASLIQIREHFIPEMLKSVEDL